MAKKGVYIVVSDIPLYGAHSALGSHFTQSPCWWLTTTLTNCAMLAFTHSVWPSVCGWNAVDILQSIPGWSHTCPQNIDVNWGPLSKTIVNGSSWRRTTTLKINSASPGVSIVMWQAMKSRILESLSTTTQIASNQSQSVNPTTKSTEMSSNGLFRTSKGERTSNIKSVVLWDCWQLWQLRKYQSTSVCSIFHKYCRSRWSKGFVHPSYPANAVSWCSWHMHQCRASLAGTYRLPLYRICPSSSIHLEIVISWGPQFIWIASIILPSCGSATYASAVWSEMEGWPCAGGLPANTHNCSGRFCSFRTTCSIFFNLSSPPQGGLQASLSKLPLFQLNSQVYELFGSQTGLGTQTIVLASVSNGSIFWTGRFHGSAWQRPYHIKINDFLSELPN